MEISDPSTASDDVALDWSAIQREITCPLCDYNLRGLSEPRCPECGHRFVWKEILDETNRVHPYLFEHHPERNFVSFFRTLGGSLRIIGFWRRLGAYQSPRPRRLIVYGLLAALPVCLFLVVYVGWPVGEQFYDVMGQRELARARGPGLWPRLTLSAEQIEARIAWQFPWPSVSDGLWHRLDELTRKPFLPLALVLLAWPWLSLVTLSVFWISMRKANINRVHVLRCVIYSADLLFWAGWAALAGQVIVGYQSPQGPAWWLSENPMDAIANSYAVVVFGILLSLFAFRLTMAYRLYLRFDHPTITVVLSQVIVILIAFEVMVLFNGIRVFA